MHEWVDLERRFGSGTLGNGKSGVGEGQVHRWRLCGGRVENAVGCRLEICLRRSGHVAFEVDFGGDEAESASLMADSSGIDC